MFRRWLVLGVAFVAAGCDEPGSTCERAQARLNECNEQARAEYEQQLRVEGYVELPISLTSCESVPNQCLASCVVDSPCSVINWDILHGGHTDPNAVRPSGAGQFSLCVEYCVALARPNR